MSWDIPQKVDSAWEDSSKAAPPWGQATGGWEQVSTDKNDANDDWQGGTVTAAGNGEEESGYDDSDRPRGERPDMVCYNCQGTGHGARSCPEPARPRDQRPYFDWSHHPEMSSEDAWEMVKEADKARDLDDIKEAVEIYVKNTPDATFQSIEQRLRDDNCHTHLLCFEKVLPMNKTNVDLQNNVDKKYAVGFQLAFKSLRARMNQGMMAETYEENFERLGDCGFTVTSRVPVCYQCHQKGHIGKECPEERPDPELRDLSHIVKIECSNCSQEGHRLRNCPEPRKVRSKGCRNCGSEEHMVAECDQPRRPKEGETCHNCGSEEHYGKDCPEPKKERSRACRNCGSEDHMVAECDQPRRPRDGETCHNCGSVEHYGRDCPEAKQDNRACYNCQQSGHIGRDCPEPRQGRFEGRSDALQSSTEPANGWAVSAADPPWDGAIERQGW